jgi:hypothetical protein
MFANLPTPLYREILFRFLFIFLLFFLQCVAFAQLPTEIPDNIDPSILKQASPSALQSFLKDKNQNQRKAGEDVHRSR